MSTDISLAQIFVLIYKTAFLHRAAFGVDAASPVGVVAAAAPLELEKSSPATGEGVDATSQVAPAAALLELEISSPATGEGVDATSQVASVAAPLELEKSSPATGEGVDATSQASGTIKWFASI
jgi:hypothetical protein